MSKFDKSRLKPLMLCLSQSWGGLEKVVASDCVDLAEQGFPVKALVLKNSPIHDYLKNRVDVHTIDIVKRNIFDYGLYKKLKNLYLEFDINLVHVHQPNLLSTITASLIGFKKIGLVASRHILNNHNKKDPFHSLIYNRVDYLVVISNTMKENILATHPIADKKVKVVNLGLDFARFDPTNFDKSIIRQKYNIAENDILIGMVGRVDPAKGQDVFIKAAVKVKMMGFPVKFIIVGGETINNPAANAYRKELDRVIADLKIGNDVILTGYIENIPEVINAMDIVVMPSKEEAFGLVAIEAMVMEKPVIISRNGSGREIAGDGENALLMRPQDAFDLERQINTLLKDEALRNRMAKRARDFVLQNYNKVSRCERTLDIYIKSCRKRLMNF